MIPGSCRLITLANAVSAALLAERLVAGQAGQDAAMLLRTGASIYLTNIIAFGLWYWEYGREPSRAGAGSVRTGTSCSRRWPRWRRPVGRQPDHCGSRPCARREHPQVVPRRAEGCDAVPAI
jgi:hypothetical protein